MGLESCLRNGPHSGVELGRPTQGPGVNSCRPANLPETIDQSYAPLLLTVMGHNFYIGYITIDQSYGP